MLLGAMIEEVQDLTEDPEYWTASRVTTLINRGQRDIANFMGVSVTGYTVFESVDEQEQYQLPNDWVSPELISFTSDGASHEIRIVANPRQIMNLTEETRQTGTPTQAFIWAKADRPELWVYPLFDTDGIEVRLFYWRRPPDVSDDNDEPLVPRDWHTHLVDYAMNFINQQDGERGWNFVLFETWWEATKLGLQVSDTMQAAAHGNIRIGSYDNTLPVAGAGSSGYIPNSPDEW